MSYRILVATASSPAFYDKFYGEHPQLERLGYREHLDAFLFESFGWSDAYALAFRKLGHEADTLVVNSQALQRRWTEEHGSRGLGQKWRLLEAARGVSSLVPSAAGMLRQLQSNLLNQVFLAQVREYRPDILLVQLQTPLASSTIRAAKEYTRIVVAQIASRFPAFTDLFSAYDLILSAFPHYVSFFNDCGLQSAYLPQAFQPAFLDRCRERFGPDPGPEYDAVFIGSVSDMHQERLQWLTALAETGKVDIWLSFDRTSVSYAVPKVLRERSRGPVFGLAMYDVYRRARIALNAHPEISGPYAAIMRMFEATGAGCMLLTDERANLDQLFKPGSEVATYSTTEDCVTQLDYYLGHEAERAAIAEGGRQRTLSTHTYDERADEIVRLIQPRL